MSTYVPVALRRRVEAGAAHLDATFPEWVNVIDLSTFDLEMPCKCVLGQVVKSIDDDLDYFNLAPINGQEYPNYVPRGLEDVAMSGVAMSHDEAIARGFHTDNTVEGEDDDLQWKLLQLAWRRLIVARRNALVAK